MRTVLVLALAASIVASVAACSSSPPSTKVSATDAQNLLIDRNWLDRMPETERDKLFVYRFVPNMGGGVFQDRTLFKGTFELFSFSVKGEQITFELHETKRQGHEPVHDRARRRPGAVRSQARRSPTIRAAPRSTTASQAETDPHGLQLEATLRAKLAR